MEKKYLAIFGLVPLFFNVANANMQDVFKKEDNLNRTSCNWENAQYISNIHFTNKEYARQTIRYCVDTSKNTIWKLVLRNSGKVSKYRQEGFLNKEILIPGVFNEYGYVNPKKMQVNIEGNQLVQYSCSTIGENSKQCKGNISRFILGLKK